MLRPDFLSEELQQGPPLCSWADFTAPRLRQFPHYKENMTFHRVLGSGVDGTVLKVRFGDGEPVAMRIFHHSTRPRPVDGIIRYWPFERECQNISLLQKVVHGIETSRPIYLRSTISTRHEAAQNLSAFSTESRGENIFQELCETVALSSIPALTTCHGWMKVLAATLPSSLAPDPILDVYAIIYDFVPPLPLSSKIDTAVVQAQLDFFYIIGFSIEALKADNWVGKGLLVDFCDVLSPLNNFWYPSAVRYGADAMFSLS